MGHGAVHPCAPYRLIASGRLSNRRNRGPGMPTLEAKGRRGRSGLLDQPAEVLLAARVDPDGEASDRLRHLTRAVQVRVGHHQRSGALLGEAQHQRAPATR